MIDLADNPIINLNFTVRMHGMEVDGMPRKRNKTKTKTGTISSNITGLYSMSFFFSFFITSLNKIKITALPGE